MFRVEKTGIRKSNSKLLLLLTISTPLKKDVVPETLP